jgi:hypothetical protein
MDTTRFQAAEAARKAAVTKLKQLIERFVDDAQKLDDWKTLQFVERPKDEGGRGFCIATSPNSIDLDSAVTWYDLRDAIVAANAARAEEKAAIQELPESLRPPKQRKK